MMGTSLCSLCPSVDITQDAVRHFPSYVDLLELRIYEKIEGDDGCWYSA